MSKAYKCDRCGEFGEQKPQAKIEHYGRGQKYEVGDDHGKTTIELCPNCAIQFIDWYGRRGGS